MSTISIRCSTAERIKLKAQGQTHGFNSLTDFIRWKLEMKPRIPNELADDIPDTEVVDLEHLLPLAVKNTDMTIEIHNNIIQICRKLGIKRYSELTQEKHREDKANADDEGFSRG